MHPRFPQFIVSIALLLLLFSCGSENGAEPDFTNLPMCQYLHNNRDDNGRAWENGAFCMTGDSASKPQTTPCAEECSLPPYVGDPITTVADPNNETLAGGVNWGTTTGTHQIANDGSFSYAVQLQVPTGMGVIEPKLTLAYNSSKTNSPLGWGWAGSYDSFVHRCAASRNIDGHLSGIGDGDRYKYCLDGKRLVQVASNEYRLLEDNFSKIYRRSDYWEVVSKNGLIARYGFNANAKLSSKNESQGWYLDREEDVFGNYIEYSHSKSGGVILIQDIVYARNNKINGNPEQAIHFVYQQRPDLAGGYSAGAFHLTRQRVSASAPSKCPATHSLCGATI